MDFITKNGLETIFNMNTSAIKAEILNKLFENVSSEDKNGYVYGFYNENDINTTYNFKIKLGRSERKIPEKRIAEWSDSDQVFTKKTLFDRKLESLIRLFFNFSLEYKFIGTKKEIEWHHFKNEHKMNENAIVRLVTQIDDLMNDCHCNDYPTKPKKIICRKIFSSKPKNDSDDDTDDSYEEIEKPKNIKSQKKISFDEETKAKIKSTITTYNSSNYFHVGPRRELFDFLKRCYEMDTLGKIQSLSQQNKLKETMKIYYPSNYFHVGPRREIFAAIQLYID